MMKATCRHCNRCAVNRPRGLCWTCYYTPGVRDKYPSTSKYANRGVGNGYINNAPLPEPTTAEPGTVEKMAVMALRAKMKQQLHHPKDPKCGPIRVPEWTVPQVSDNGQRRKLNTERDSHSR